MGNNDEFIKKLKKKLGEGKLDLRAKLKASMTPEHKAKLAADMVELRKEMKETKDREEAVEKAAMDAFYPLDIHSAPKILAKIIDKYSASDDRNVVGQLAIDWTMAEYVKLKVGKQINKIAQIHAVLTKRNNDKDDEFGEMHGDRYAYIIPTGNDNYKALHFKNQNTQFVVVLKRTFRFRYCEEQDEMTKAEITAERQRLREKGTTEWELHVRKVWDRIEDLDEYYIDEGKRSLLEKLNKNLEGVDDAMIEKIAESLSKTHVAHPHAADDDDKYPDRPSMQTLIDTNFKVGGGYDNSSPLLRYGDGRDVGYIISIKDMDKCDALVNFNDLKVFSWEMEGMMHYINNPDELE